MHGFHQLDQTLQFFLGIVFDFNSSLIFVFSINDNLCPHDCFQFFFNLPVNQINIRPVLSFRFFFIRPVHKFNKLFHIPNAEILLDDFHGSLILALLIFQTEKRSRMATGNPSLDQHLLDTGIQF